MIEFPLRRTLLSSLACLALVLSLPRALSARTQEGYKKPPRAIEEIVSAKPAPSLSFSPDGQWILMAGRDAMPSIEEVSAPMLRLAGMRLDPATDGRYRTQYENSLSLRSSGAATERVLSLPEGSKLGQRIWSQDSNHFAYTTVSAEGTTLWLTSRSNPGRVHSLKGVNSNLQSPRFMPDGHTLLVLLNPEERGAPPQAPRVPGGPNIQTTNGGSSGVRTYQDMLTSAHDEALFEYHCRTRIGLLSGLTGKLQRIGKSALHSSVSPSPDDELLLVQSIQRPYSRLLPYYQFAASVEVIDRQGKPVAQVASQPLGDKIPLHGVATGPRNVAWRVGRASQLIWVEALDGGDPKAEVSQRDRWMTLGAPFDGEAEELLRVEHRAMGLTFLRDGEHVIAGDYDRDRRWVRTQLVNLKHPEQEVRTLESRNTRDAYGNPGSLLMQTHSSGVATPHQDGPWLYRAGSGASDEGLLPFLDRQNLETLEVERLWRSELGSFERVAGLEVPDAEGQRAFRTLHESPSSPPNYRMRRTGSKDWHAITEFADPVPQIRGIRKQLVSYERADGVPLSATLYLPADYDGKQPLPLFLWGYPLEYNDPGSAGQVTTSDARFTRISGLSHLALVTQGYAVMDGATMPVIGDPETMNDTFVEQIVAAAQAAIDKAVEMGVADRNRVGVGGHSYGAFMTANLLAHSDLFKAGVARSGAYNRSLTPFGFQSERRTFWEDPAAYFSVSPFMHADHLEAPLLMIHGEIDNNSGTFPIQSRRMFQAIKGHGGTARLVMLPNESHGYRAAESVLHVQAETVEWLDRYVKNAPPVQ